jgi:hypothetical protein
MITPSPETNMLFCSDLIYEGDTAGVAQRLDPSRLDACAALALVDGYDYSSSVVWVPSSIGTRWLVMFHYPCL